MQRHGRRLAAAIMGALARAGLPPADVIRAAQALSDVRIGPMRMLAPLTLSGLPSLRNLDGFNSGMNVLVFQFGQVGFSEADGLALANRITVRGAVCNLDSNRCYPGPPWRP